MLKIINLYVILSFFAVYIINYINYPIENAIQKKFYNQCSQKCTSFRPKVHTERALFFVVLKAIGNHKSGAPESVMFLADKLQYYSFALQ